LATRHIKLREKVLRRKRPRGRWGGVGLSEKKTVPTFWEKREREWEKKGRVYVFQGKKNDGHVDENFK